MPETTEAVIEYPPAEPTPANGNGQTEQAALPPSVQPKPLAPPTPAPPVVPERFMRRSDTLGKLFGALAKAQGEMQPAEKDSVNEFFSTNAKPARYASLGSVWKSCRGPLAKHGLCVIQVTRGLKTAIEVETTLGHESGEWIAETLRMPAVVVDRYGKEIFSPQTMKSAGTYAKRTSLEGVAGVAAEDDDDGQAASEQAEQGQASRTEHRPAVPSGMSPEEWDQVKAFRQSLDDEVTTLLQMNAEALPRYMKMPKGLVKSNCWNQLNDFGRQQGWKYNGERRVFIQAGGSQEESQ
jgi:hypothetical protein